jgi:hypothetical protein
MTTVQPRRRIRFAQKEVFRFREDIEDCIAENLDLVIDLGLARDLVDRSNYLFGWIMLVDNSIRVVVLEGYASDELIDFAKEVLRQWLEVSLLLLQKIDRLESEHGIIEGTKEFRAKIAEARGIFTPDEDFFRDDKLIELRDQAIDQHRAGQSEELVQHVQPQA